MKADAYRRLLAARMSEAELERAVSALCKVHQVKYVHHLWSKGTTPGWPDDALVGTELLLRELKRQKGRVMPAQAEMIADLDAAGVNVAVWRPSDLHSGLIAAQIAAISPRRLSGSRS